MSVNTKNDGYYRATVRMVIEVDARGSWDEDSTLDEIMGQACSETRAHFLKAMEGATGHGGVPCKLVACKATNVNLSRQGEGVG